jgi:biopolymer transport protein ExbB
MKKTIVMSLVATGILTSTFSFTYAQDLGGDAGAAPAVEATGDIIDSPDAAPSKASSGGSNQFWQVLTGSGFIGALLWFCLFGCLGWMIYLAIDCGILVREPKIMPQELINSVEMAMKEGDIIKAIQFCENSPTPMASILKAGFSHVEEGFDIIEQAIGTAAGIEIEKLMQHISWLSVIANIATMFGLLGTVQGMILAFSNLAGGTPDMGALALAISQALWTTAAGLGVAIPGTVVFYFYRNKANRIVLHMEALTSELIKDLRNVEVVAE